jgi:hypothetical protein
MGRSRVKPDPEKHMKFGLLWIERVLYYRYRKKFNVTTDVNRELSAVANEYMKERIKEER